MPLNERTSQIPSLVQKILKINNSKKVFSNDALILIQQYPWRDLAELITTIEAIDILFNKLEITAKDLVK